MAPSLSSQTLGLFAGKALAYLVMAVAPMILVRFLSPDQFGTYRQVLFVYAVALPIIKFQIPESLYFFYPRKAGGIHRYLSQTITLLCINGVIGGGLILFLGGYLELLPSGLNTDFVLPLAAFLMIEAVGSLIEHIFVLEKNIPLTFIGNLGNSILRLVLVVGAVYLFADVLFMLYALILWATVRLGATFFYLFKKYPIRLGFPGRGMFREQMRYSLPLAIGGIIGLVGAQVDKGIVSGTLSAQEFALYSLGGLGIMNAVKILYVSVGNVFVPRFGELALENNLPSIRLLWHKMIVMNAIATIPIVTFCCIYAPHIISLLYTPRYIQAADLWRLSMMVLLIQMLGFGYIPKALGRTGAIFAGNIARFAVSVPLAIVLITELGLIGGVIAFVAGFWANALIQLRECKVSLNATIGTLLPWNRLLRIIFVCLAASGTVFLVSDLATTHLVRILIGAVCFFPTVAILLFCFRIVNIDEIRHLFKKHSSGSRHGHPTRMKVVRKTS